MMFNKRKHFIIKFLIGSILVLGLFLLFTPILNKLLSGFIIGGRTALSFLLLLGLFYFCFQRNFIDTLFCSVAALLTQNMGANLYDIVKALLNIEGFQPLSIYMFLSFIFIYFLTWLFCSRQLKGLENIAVNRIMTLVIAIIAYFLACYFFM